ncbi:hypothetical protein J6590_076597 [Homalodisca vitripennis]|nr:hypothetical protein J6590_076597 [Homalodisca vitripennis]
MKDIKSSVTTLAAVIVQTGTWSRHHTVTLMVRGRALSKAGGRTQVAKRVDKGTDINDICLQRNNGRYISSQVTLEEGEPSSVPYTPVIVGTLPHIQVTKCL